MPSFTGRRLCFQRRSGSGSEGLLSTNSGGDKELLRRGFPMLYERIPIPVAGVVPYMDIDLDDEDSLADRLSSHRKGLPG